MALKNTRNRNRVSMHVNGGRVRSFPTLTIHYMDLKHTHVASITHNPARRWKALKM